MEPERSLMEPEGPELLRQSRRHLTERNPLAKRIHVKLDVVRHALHRKKPF